MTTLFRGICVATVLVAALTSCDKFKKKDDADAAAPDDAATAAADPDAGATPAPTAAPAAANEPDIARFPDEAKLDNVAATLQRFTNAREVPQSGKLVAQLQKGTAVTELASRKDAFLVTFADPKDASKRLMGWIPAESFTAAPAVDAGVVTKIPSCVAGDTVLISDTVFCGRVCNTDADCPTPGQACKGASNKFVNGKAADPVKVCVVFSAPTQPTGTAAKVPGVTPVTPTPPPPPAGDVVPASGGTCPIEFFLIRQDGQCHKRCKAGCTGGNQCVRCNGVQVCANPALCK